MAEQIPFAPDLEIASNPEQRCPCVLLLDTSGSMGEIVQNSGKPLGYTIQQDGQTYNAVSGGTSRIDRSRRADPRIGAVRCNLGGAERDFRQAADHGPALHHRQLRDPGLGGGIDGDSGRSG